MYSVNVHVLHEIHVYSAKGSLLIAGVVRRNDIPGSFGSPVKFTRLSESVSQVDLAELRLYLGQFYL